MDPVFLRQFDEDPDERHRIDDMAPGKPPGVPACADAFDEFEEIFERIGKDEEQQPKLHRLEKRHPDQPVIPEKPAGAECMQIGPVPHRRDIGDGQIVDIERFVVALIPIEIEIREVLENGLIGCVDDHRRDDGRKREARDRQRDEETQPDHDGKDDEILGMPAQPAAPRSID